MKAAADKVAREVGETEAAITVRLRPGWTLSPPTWPPSLVTSSIGAERYGLSSPVTYLVIKDRCKRVGHPSHQIHKVERAKEASAGPHKDGTGPERYGAGRGLRQRRRARHINANPIIASTTMIETKTGNVQLLDVSELL